MMNFWTKISIKACEIKGCGPTMLDRLVAEAYSQALTHYCSTRGLLLAAFQPWAGSSLLRQPGESSLRMTPTY